MTLAQFPQPAADTSAVGFPFSKKYRTIVPYVCFPPLSKS